jgi:hypothetical protein
MKFYLDINTRRIVRSAASAIPLETLFLKRRDAFEIEVVLVDRTGIVPTPSGTTYTAGIKRTFADTQFLAVSDPSGLLDLYTADLDALFADDPASISAFIEIKSISHGEQTRSHTLAVEIQNSIILGGEGTPITFSSPVSVLAADLAALEARVAALEAAT